MDEKTAPFTPPTTDDARAAQAALDAAAFEQALCAAGDYLNGRRQAHGAARMTGREIGALMGAVALAIRAYQRDDATTPMTARWDKLVSRDEDGTVWVMCVAEDGRPIALQLDTEHAEALGGSLIGDEEDDVQALYEDLLHQTADPVIAKILTGGAMADRRRSLTRHRTPAACLSPMCPRPGTNSAGYCCHGCARSSRFGAALPHGDRCEAAHIEGDSQ
jgi:hypothetical protein